MVEKRNLRQDVWQAAFDALTTHGIGEGARSAIASDIVSRFSQTRLKTSGSHTVSQATKEAIAADLERGGLSFFALKDKHGVGISTIQRVAEELRVRGKTVRTAGQTNPGLSIPA